MGKLDRDTATRLRKAVVRERLYLDGLSRSERGAAARRIAEEFGLSERAVREHVAAVRSDHLAPSPRADRGGSKKLTPDAVDYLRHLRRTSPIQSIRLVREALSERFPALQASHDTVRRCVQRLDSERVSLGVKTPQPIEFRHPLDRWEVDLSISDFFLSDPDVADGLPKRVNLWCLIDAATRCVAAACYSAHGDASVLGRLVYEAMLPKERPELWPVSGTPVEIMADWGKVFVGSFGTALLADLGVKQAKSLPYYPQSKPHVERWFQTCHRGLEAALPGWCGPDNKGEDSIDPTKVFRFDGRRWVDPRPCLGFAADRPLLTIAQANEHLQCWIMERYHQDRHSDLGCSPVVAWQTGISAVMDRLHHPPVEVMEEVCLLQRAQRMVRRGQVRLKGLDYHHERLADYEGLGLEVRYNLEDCRAVSCYHEGTRICRAEAVGTLFISPGEAGFRKRKEIADVERNRAKRRREVVKESTPHEARELRRDLEPIAQQNAPDLVPVATPREQVPEWAHGLDAEERREIAGIRVFGVPVVPDSEQRLLRAAGDE